MIGKAKRLFEFRVLLVLVVVLIMSACSDGSNETNGESQNSVDTEGMTLSIASGTTGSALNAVGNGLASVVSSNSSVQMDVKPFSGISAYGNLLNNGEDVFLAATTGPELTWTYRGEQGYSKAENLRLLVAGNTIVSTGIVVREDGGIDKVADLAGKRVGSYEAAPIGDQVVEATLAANGLSRDDVTSVPVTGGAEGIEAIRDDTIDGAYSYAPEAPLVQEVHNSIGLKGIPIVDDTAPSEIDDIPQDVLDEFTSRIPGASLTVVEPVGFIAEELIAVQFPIGIGVSSHVNDDMVYEIMETLWEHYEELHSTHAWFTTWDQDLMFDENPTVPYHEGAVQFFKDQGLWTDEIDEIQKELLQLAG